MQHINKMFILSEMKTADIIIDNPFLLLMMEHLEINLEVREKSVVQICDEKHINTDFFLTIANLFNGYKPSSLTGYTSGNVRTIIMYLENSHRYYLKEIYPRIRKFIEEINKVNDHSEILMIGKFFDKYFIEVTEHLDYENTVVFPYVLDLDNFLTQKSSKRNVSSYSVTEYTEHHNDIEEKLTDLKNLLIKYMPQKNDQEIRRQLILSLFELEYDLNIHSQIEESILIPLVEKMEQLVKKRK